MNKPKFIFFLGTAFSASSPLYKMVRNHITSGVAKEHHLADMTQWIETAEYEEKLSRCKKKIYWYHRLGSDSGEIVTSFPDFSNWSIQKYVDYYKNLWDYRGYGRDVLVDWSNSNYQLDADFTQRLLKALSQEFDVSALMVCRDPVRRAWSWLNYGWNDYSKILGNIKNENSDIHSAAEIKFADLQPYHKVIENAKNVCPVHVLIMEEVWAGKTQLLNDLFGQTEFAPNLYYPDRGNKAVRYQYQKDQWSSDQFNMTDEQYYEYKNIMSHHYEGWNIEGWGVPVNYKRNCSLPITGIREENIKKGTYRKVDDKLYVDFTNHIGLYSTEYIDTYFWDRVSN